MLCAVFNHGHSRERQVPPRPCNQGPFARPHTFGQMLCIAWGVYLVTARSEVNKGRPTVRWTLSMHLATRHLGRSHTALAILEAAVKLLEVMVGSSASWWQSRWPPWLCAGSVSSGSSYSAGAPCAVSQINRQDMYGSLLLCVTRKGVFVVPRDGDAGLSAQQASSVTRTLCNLQRPRHFERSVMTCC